MVRAFGFMAFDFVKLCFELRARAGPSGLHGEG